MADGRMLAKKISLNEAVASLESDMHRLLFTWGLAHLDIEGRISGSPKVFRAIVAPLLEHITSDKISKFFKDAESQGLLRRYQVEKEWFIEYPKFKDNQRLRPDREAPSKLPPPPAQLPADSGSDPGAGPEDAGLKFKLSLREDKNPPTPLTGEAPPFQKIIDLWNTHAPELLPRASLTETRKPKIKTAWKEHPDLEWWKALFTDISLSSWHSHQDKWRGCSFDWILKKRTEMREKLDAIKKSNGGAHHPPGKAVNLPEDPPGILVFDPSCPVCRGDGFKTMGKCKCARTREEIHASQKTTTPAQ